MSNLNEMCFDIALLQEDMNILKEEHRHDDTSGNTVLMSIHNYKEGTFSSVNGKSWKQVTVDPYKKISPNLKKYLRFFITLVTMEHKSVHTRL
jgi:hypothetical protein